MPGPRRVAIASTTQSIFLAWFLLFTGIGAAFDASMLGAASDAGGLTAAHLLPTAWVFRAFIVLVFRGFLATWPREPQGRALSQRVIYFALLPPVALLLPMLPLRIHLTPPSPLIAVCIAASALAFIGLLRHIRLDRFAYVKSPRETAHTLSEFWLYGVGYGMAIAVVTYGYCRYF